MRFIDRTCVICDALICVREDDWEACVAPAAACRECSQLIIHQRIPWPFVKMLYFLRCQVSKLEQDVARMLTAQQEMEQELLQLQA